MDFTVSIIPISNSSNNFFTSSFCSVHIISELLLYLWYKQYHFDCQITFNLINQGLKLLYKKAFGFSCITDTNHKNRKKQVTKNHLLFSVLTFKKTVLGIYVFQEWRLSHQ